MITDLEVYRDEIGLDEVDHFEGHKQRNWDKVHESDEPDSCLDADLQGQALVVVRVARVQVPVLRSSEIRPNGCCNGSSQTQDKLEQHRDHNILVRGRSNL